jgi:signal transduction histidine kinase
MPDYYQVPALIITLLLLPAFGYMYLRFRDTRTLLWFLGFLFATLRMLQHYNLVSWYLSNGRHPWLAAAGQTSALISAALFLASLSPLRFRIGRLNVLYVIPFAIPIVIYSILLNGVFRGVAPTGPVFLVFPALGAVSIVVACRWCAAKGSIPVLVTLPLGVVLGSLGLWICIAFGCGWALIFVECAIRFMTALLLVFVFRRISAGVMLSVLGFLAWSLSILEILPAIGSNPAFDLNLVRVIIFSKVVAAMGMILLALEDQLAINQAAQLRERRARQELEAYTHLILSRRRVEDFDRQGEEICQTVVQNSRFAKAALLLESQGQFRLAGSAGFDGAIAKALASLAARIPTVGFLEPGLTPPVVEHAQTVAVDFTPWLIPGDDLKRLRFTGALAVPIIGRLGTDGVLLLAGMRNPPAGIRGPVHNRLHADDLLPVEVLTARLQAARGQTMMLEKLIDSEKFAGVGQLAANVAEQLNNPLTVVLGYASLLDERTSLETTDRKAVEAILVEARRMKSTLDSLARVARHRSDQLTAVSVAELLADMEELHRPEFLQRSIDFRLSIAPALPMVLCHAQHLRHAVLHCLQFAIEAVDGSHSIQGPISALPPAAPGADPKTIRLEATSEGNLVQILVAHSGPGFLQPDRAFDPYASAQPNGETAGLGLSLCATILRDHNGRASAINLEPRGAAIILELQAA